MATIRDFTDKEKDPKYQLAVFRNPELAENWPAREAAAETFEWPWDKLSEGVYGFLGSLEPDRDKSQLAAWEYLDSSSRRVDCKSIWSPLFILGLAAIGLAVMGLAFGRG